MRSIILFLTTTFLLYSSDTITLGHLEWQDNKESKVKKINWYDAVYYCKELKLGGKDDWRLPTLRELQSIVNIYAYKPSIKKGFKFTNTKSFYWSSTISAASDDKAWHVFYKYGDSYFSKKFEKYRVRCVRFD